jgi:5-methylcytosine-specific restriction endonuclease McrA
MLIAALPYLGPFSRETPGAITNDSWDLVRFRAGERCEYCRLHQEHSEVIDHVEHIVAKQHGGSDDPGNLALACHRCNLHKEPNLTGIDPPTSEMAALFHPRQS